MCADSVQIHRKVWSLPRLSGHSSTVLKIVSLSLDAPAKAWHILVQSSTPFMQRDEAHFLVDSVFNLLHIWKQVTTQFLLEQREQPIVWRVEIQTVRGWESKGIWTCCSHWCRNRALWAGAPLRRMPHLLALHIWGWHHLTGSCSSCRISRWSSALIPYPLGTNLW